VDPDIKVTAPANPESAYVLRMVLAIVLARVGLPVDEIEDMKIALSEATAQLLRLQSSGTLAMTITEGDGNVRILLSTNDGRHDWPPHDLERTLAWTVLTTLAEDVTFDREDGRARLAFAKRLTHDPQPE
jgi:serine/threonine-protein kinase RsbW